MKFAIAAAAIAVCALYAGAASAETYSGKIVFNGTFTEEAKWDTHEGLEHDTGSGSFTLRVSTTHAVTLDIDHGVVTVIDTGHQSPGQSMSGEFKAGGSHSEPNKPDQGSMKFGGAKGTVSASVIDDFAANGDGLGFSVSYDGTMKGACSDALFGADCSLNTAGEGEPMVISGGGSGASKGTMPFSGSATFSGGTAGGEAGDTPVSTDWQGLSCSGGIAGGWTCSFSGSRTFHKADGITHTQRVQVQAKVEVGGRK